MTKKTAKETGPSLQVSKLDMVVARGAVVAVGIASYFIADQAAALYVVGVLAGIILSGVVDVHDAAKRGKRPPWY